MSKPPLSLSDRSHRAGAMLNYGLMFFATFTFGLLSPLALILAYARRKGADPISRSHYDHQIKSFWQDIILIVVGAACGYGAIALGIGTLLGISGVNLPGGVSGGQAGMLAIGLALAWGVLWIWGFLNLIIDSAVGFMKLASGKPAGKKPRT